MEVRKPTSIYRTDNTAGSGQNQVFRFVAVTVGLGAAVVVIIRLADDPDEFTGGLNVPACRHQSW